MNGHKWLVKMSVISSKMSFFSSNRFLHAHIQYLCNESAKYQVAYFEKEELNSPCILDPSIPGLVTIVLNTYFIDMMKLWL